jgi:DNA-binding MarR family transcriptional regulator
MSDSSVLTRDEFEAWLPFMAALELLPPAINSTLQHTTGQTLTSLYVLGHLARQPGRSAGVSELAACTSAPLPRMSRLLAKMERDGLVARSACAGDGRAVTMTITGQGEDALQQAMPYHDRIIRELFVDALTAEQLGQLRDIAATLVRRLHPDTSLPVDRQRPLVA